MNPRLPAATTLSRWLRCVLIGGFLLTVLACGNSQKKKTIIDLDRNPPAPAEGQVYSYEHKGPQPWGDGRQDATGGRIVVVPGTDEGNKSLWKFEERYEKNTGVETLYLDKDYKLHRRTVESGDFAIQIQYASPFCYRYLDLKKGNKKTYHSLYQILEPKTGTLVGNGNYSVQVERKYDVRIVTPAGAYLCRQYITTVRNETTVLKTQTVLQAKINSYWCDDIGWFVREEYEFDPMTRNGNVTQPGYQAESTLLEYKPMDPNRLHPPEEPPDSAKKKP